MKRIYALTFITLFLFAGCATMDNLVSDLNKDRVLKKAVLQSIVRAFLGEKPVEWARAVHLAMEKGIEKVDNSLITEIDGLEAHVKASINFESLYESDKIIIQSLITRVRADMEKTIKHGGITDSMVYVKSVLMQINEVAKEFI